MSRHDPNHLSPICLKPVYKTNTIAECSAYASYVPVLYSGGVLQEVETNRAAEKKEEKKREKGKMVVVSLLHLHEVPTQMSSWEA